MATKQPRQVTGDFQLTDVQSEFCCLSCAVVKQVYGRQISAVYLENGALLKKNVHMNHTRDFQGVKTKDILNKRDELVRN